MRAMGINEYGDNEAVVELDVAEPKVGPDTVLIRVKSSSVNPVDWKIRSGYLDGAFPRAFPMVLGWDVAGVVEATGTAVPGFAAGDEVLAYARKHWIQEGTYAELVAVPWNMVSRKPAGVTWEQAGTLPLAGLTAWQALTTRSALTAEQTVVISAAGGGVGHLAVQLAAKEIGATVIAIASADKHDFVKGLGASHVVDHHDEDWVEQIADLSGGNVDLWFDLVGGFEEDAAKVLVATGHAVSIQGPPDLDQLGSGRTGAHTFVVPDAAQLEFLAGLIDEGKFAVHIDSTFPIWELPKAFAKSEDGHVIGKLALVA